jgi:hypothetical protein
VDEVEKQAIHAADRHPKEFLNEPYVSCLAEGAEWLASEERLVLGKGVDRVLVHSRRVEDTEQEVAVSGWVDSDLIVRDWWDPLFAHLRETEMETGEKVDRSGLVLAVQAVFGSVAARSDQYLL